MSLLRKALEPNLERGSRSRFVLQKRPGYAFDRHPDCEVDTWNFEEHRQRAEAAQRAGEYDEAIEERRAALDLFGGEFLAEDVYEEWAAEAREEWRETRLAVLSELSECLALRGRYTEAIESCERALEEDGYREDFHRRLMLFHYCAGEQTHALRAYRRYARTLKEELGASPSPEMEKLKERIEARDVPGVDEARRYPKPRRPLKFPYLLSRTHFVGRDAEYALLAERLREAGEGSGGAVAVEGETGVGKTRLVEEFIGYARSRGARVFSGRCYERDLGPPLEPISDALGPLPDIESPGLSGLGGGSHWGAAMREDGAEIYHSFTAKLIRESREDGSGLVLFVDDVQWADAAALDFLSYAARRIPGERVLIVMTYRLEDAPGLSAWLDRFADRRTITLLSLDRLSREDTMELLGRMSSRAFGGVGVLADFLHRESEGNPFYTVEYLRWLIEAGAVHIDSRRRISGMDSEALREGALPSGVRTLLRARFAALGEEARNVLKTAAVIGRRFDPELLSKAAFLDEDEALRAIEPLTRSGLVAEVSEAYHFSHDKLRQTLYEDIGGRERRKLHLRVAGAIEEAGGEPAELAHHYARARAWRPALDSLIRAAEKAEDGYAWENALEENARALEVMEKLSEPDEETRFEILKARERLLEHLDRQEERAAVVAEMFVLAKRMGGKHRIAEVHVRRIGVLMALPDTEGATGAGREAVSIFRELGDEAGEARAHRELGYARRMGRDYSGALEANFQAIRIHRELEHRRGEAGDAGNIAHVYRGMRDYDNALRWNEEAIRIDRELGDKLGEAFRLNSMALIERERGNPEAALSLNLESIPLLAALGAKNLSTTQHVNCGTLYMSLGSPEEALKHFRSALVLSRETGYVRDEGYAHMSIGSALEQTGDPDGAADSYRRAVELLQRAYEESEMPKELSAKADALTLLGTMLHRSLEEPEEALDAYEAAARIYRPLGEGARLRKLLMNLAGLLWQTGDPESSLREYEEALALAREHGEKAHEAAALACMGVVHRDLGDHRRAIRRGKEALELLRELEDPQAEAYVLTSLAASHGELGHHPSALSCLKRSLRLRREIRDEEGGIRTLHDLAGIYESFGKRELARNTLEEAESKKETLEKAKKVFAIMERRS